MGYTHYWSASRNFTDDEWIVITDGARKIAAAARSNGIELAWECDEIDKPVQIDAKCIRFNGIVEEGHETFLLSAKVPKPPEYRKTEPDFQFCKTARKDYDPVVVAVLIFAKHSAPDSISWSSDGWLSEHVDGLALLKQATGLDLEWSNVDPADNDPDRLQVTNVVSLDHARDEAS